MEDSDTNGTPVDELDVPKAGSPVIKANEEKTPLLAESSTDVDTEEATTQPQPAEQKESAADENVESTKEESEHSLDKKNGTASNENDRKEDTAMTPTALDEIKKVEAASDDVKGGEVVLDANEKSEAASDNDKSSEIESNNIKKSGPSSTEDETSPNERVIKEAESDSVKTRELESDDVKKSEPKSDDVKKSEPESEDNKSGPESDDIKKNEPESDDVKKSEPESDDVKKSEPELADSKSGPESEDVEKSEPESDKVQKSESESGDTKKSESESGGAKKSEPKSDDVKKSEPESDGAKSAKPTDTSAPATKKISGRELDGEALWGKYVHRERPKLLATPPTGAKLPEGAKFFREVSRHSILEIEFANPFEKIKLFSLVGVEKRPITLKDVPAEYRPYKGCIFDALSSPDDDQRLADLTKFYSELATDGHPSRTCGLMYTVMQIWQIVYRLGMHIPSLTGDKQTYHFFVKAGMYTCFLRILGYCLDKKFLATEYNRYVPYRIFELFFAASQSELDDHSYMVEHIIDESDTSIPTLKAIANGGISCIEQLACVQVIGNMSCFTPGALWLIDHPEIVGIVGRHLWCSYDTMYLKYRQCEDRRINYHKHITNTHIDLSPNKETHDEYKPTPIRVADLTTFVSLCCMVNVCAAHPEDTSMDDLEPSLLEVVKEGLYWHMGDVCHGIHLNDSRYTTDLTIDKFLSFLSWSTFQKPSQKILMEQVRALPNSQQDGPLLYFDRASMTRSRSVVAFLITHALWLDLDIGSHYAIEGLVELITKDSEYAVEVTEMIGDQLFDLAHSYHHVRMPCDGGPMSVKRFVFETFLKLGGYTFFDEQGYPSKISRTQFDKGKHPQCVKDVRAFCERYIKEIQLKNIPKERQVRAADAFKSEGNAFFAKGQLESAIICYTKALDTCPLSCTERRVTYHSNRAECYLKTNKLVDAVRDCNKALAMNPRNLKARWRRAQALQHLHKNYPAALDLLTIRHQEVEAKKILGDKLYWELDEMIYKLLDGATFLELTARKNGSTICQGVISRDYGTPMVPDENTDKNPQPPYRGQHYHEIFGLGKGHFAD